MARGPGKGNTNNPKGKPKGTQNETTKALKEFYVTLLDGERAHIKDALKKLREESAHQYLMAIDKISNKVVANKKDITSDGNPIQAGITIIEDKTKPEAD
jgi:hypothetical protein